MAMSHNIRAQRSISSQFEIARYLTPRGWRRLRISAFRSRTDGLGEQSRSSRQHYSDLLPPRPESYRFKSTNILGPDSGSRVRPPSASMPHVSCSLDQGLKPTTTTTSFLQSPILSPTVPSPSPPAPNRQKSAMVLHQTPYVTPHILHRNYAQAFDSETIDGCKGCAA